MESGAGGRLGTLTPLRVFAAAVAAGSFSAAARRLGISQPAVSEQIRSLETHFGLALFERGGREARLTAAGARLYAHVSRVLAALDDLEWEMRALREGTGGMLEVAASPIPGEAILPLLLPRFQALLPGVQVRESVGDTRAVVERLLQREVELAVIGGPFHDARVEAVFFARDEFALVARRDHPLAGRGPLRLADVCAYPLVLRSEGSGARLAVEAALAAAGIAREQITIAAEFGSTGAVKRAVEAGLGVAFVSVCTLAVSGPAGKLRALPLADEPPARDLLVLTERGRPRTALAERFRSFLLAAETLREVDGYTRLPATLRPAPRSSPVAPRASPAAGLEADPLLPPRPPGEPMYRLARSPATPEEELVAAALRATPGGLRKALIEQLAEALRRREGDPLAPAVELAPYRLDLYREEAAALLDRLLGDLLAEVQPR